MPRGRKVSPEQIIATLRQIEVQLAQGMSLTRISHTDIGDCIWRGNPMLVEEVSQCP